MFTYACSRSWREAFLGVLSVSVVVPTFCAVLVTCARRFAPDYVCVVRRFLATTTKASDAAQLPKGKNVKRRYEHKSFGPPDYLTSLSNCRRGVRMHAESLQPHSRLLSLLRPQTLLTPKPQHSFNPKTT